MTLLLKTSLVLLAFSANTVHAQPYVSEAREILAKSVSFHTAEGKGLVPAYAAYLAQTLKASGFQDADVKITPMGETATLVATYHGTGQKKPMLLSGHMDVVEALAKDWVRDPFTMTSDNEYLYGRGVLDNKFDVTMMVATLARLKKEGFKPSRDVILVLSGDEEISMVTSSALSHQFPEADFVINGDAGGGTLSETGTPVVYNIQAAEKTYADIDISTSNPGGHSSRPGKSNAIYELARAIDKIAAYEFPVQSSALTQAFFRVTGVRTGGALGKAMQDFAADPKDKSAIAVLSADPEYIGQLRTTCVATLLKGGHALNALPQSASVSVNCRIFPGVKPQDVLDRLAKVIDNPGVKLRFHDTPVTSNASPLRADIMAAVRKAIDKNYKGLPIVPQMSVGASDSLYFRNAGISSYGVSSVFLKPSDDFSHGLNERVREDNIPGALAQWHVLITELAQ